MSRIFQEPLIHFLLLGAGLFLLFYRVADPVETQGPNHIVITRADTDRLSSQWQRQWQRPPTETEFEGLVEAFIREEILYREALQLGLDKDDVIIRRRLGQKLEFLFKDLAEQADPREEELQQFLADNPDKYALPGRFSFTHIYFNRDKRGAGTVDDARQALKKLNEQPRTVDAAALGDRFLYQYSFEGQSAAQIARIFGSDFSERLDDVEQGSWQGPIESGYGIHLVRISERTEPTEPSLAEVRDKVRWDVIAERRKEIDAAFYRELRQRYEVEFEGETDQPLIAGEASG